MDAKINMSRLYQKIKVAIVYYYTENFLDNFSFMHRIG